MLQVLGAILLIVLARTVLLLAAWQVPSSWQAGAGMLVPLIGFIGAAWAFASKWGEP